MKAMEYKTINGFLNYSVCNDGEIFNNRTGYRKNPTSNHSGKGYLYVDLYERNKRSRKYVHRLVAEAFVPNPENKPYVNHIDGNSHNNSAENLEWCTPLENVEHASKIIRTMKQYFLANEHRKRRIRMYDKNSGIEIATFRSIREAERKTRIPSSNIVSCLKGRQSYTKNYSWCYVEDYETEEKQ